MARWFPDVNLGLTADYARRKGYGSLVLTPDDQTARELLVNLRTVLGDGVEFLPGWNNHPEQAERPEPARQHHRLRTLFRLQENRSLLITTPQGLATRVVHPEAIQSLSLSPGDQQDPLSLTRKLSEMGYRRQDLVTRAGDFSLRGDLLDVYLPAHPFPIRLEFFDDELESMDYFHPNSQMIADQSLQPPVRFQPRSEFTPDPEQREKFQRELERFEPDSSRLDPGGTGPIHWFLGADNRRTPFPDKVLNPDHLIVFDHKKFQKRAEEWDKGLSSLPEQHPARTTHRSIRDYVSGFPGSVSYLSPRNEQPRKGLEPESLGEPLSVTGSFGLENEPIDRFLEKIESASTDTRTVYVHAEQQSLLDRIEILLEERNRSNGHNPTKNIQLIDSPWRGSYRTDDHARLSLDDFFNRTLGREQIGNRSGQTEYLESFEDLSNGDLVVHEDFGIGRFHGMRRVHSAGQTRDCLEIEYAGEDRLFLPPDQIGRVQKYIADFGFTPPLTGLSDDRWNRVKKRVQEDLEELASDLLELYMVREEAEVEPFPQAGVEQAQFEASFPYRETPDQQQAIEETLADLAGDTPMNRLICGDSGYGKTEVALRAAFQTAAAGKQVAVLVPTTVLARQHGQTFRERFATFPYEVRVLSRFTESSEERRTLDQLASGEVDVVIGTHRLLGDDIKFADLGLLVIDEEQRFGVKQKETLKFYRENVNVLTLSATPIPRTLYMSLSGVQDISVINSPPEERNPIDINIGTFNREQTTRALEREMGRDGQVFWLRNRIRDLEEEAHLVRSLVPEGTTVETAHGQMPREQIRDVMNRFYEGEVDVLVCTTIVEAGLDCPNANTMVVRNAHRYGLAQLYQLRGRIGRSHRKARAFLYYPETLDLTENAEARLETIKRSAELGSGFEIAMRDLEIRGAGSILGKQQHGNIRALGFPLYCKLLQRTVRRLREGFQVPKPFPKLPLPGVYYLPEEYIPAERARIRQYQSLASCRTLEEVEELEATWHSTFGPVPDPARHLLIRHRFKILCTRHDWTDLRYDNNELNLAAAQSLDRLRRAADKVGCSALHRGNRFFVRNLAPERVEDFLAAATGDPVTSRSNVSRNQPATART